MKSSRDGANSRPNSRFLKQNAATAPTNQAIKQRNSTFRSTSKWSQKLLTTRSLILFCPCLP